jgi:TetR/AcrR family transcriptional regulator, fatty acid biosynthesis regulator
MGGASLDSPKSKRVLEADKTKLQLRMLLKGAYSINQS